MRDEPSIVLIKDSKRKTITITLGREVKTMTIGEWSKLIAAPTKM